MKSYLSLIPISARVHKRQNRMTLLCIIISVLLVTAIFGAADMTLRGETLYMQDRHGSWHISLSGVSDDVIRAVSQRDDVTAVGSSAVFNFDAELPYYIGKRTAALYGTYEPYLTQLTSAVEEGTFPQSDNEVILSSNEKLALEVRLGDTITLHTPAGNTDYTISGFGSDDREYNEGQTYLVAVYMTKTAFTSLIEKNSADMPETVYYVKFHSASDAASAIPELREQYELPDGSISENTAVMGIAGQSRNESVMNIYGIAAALFIMVLIAGVLMISGSIGSNVAQRTRFFGMLRCIGANRCQIMRFVRLEALNWCKTAVPIGLTFGTLITWALCALLHYCIGGEFAFTPVFALSPAGLISGALVGIVTVILAAQSPARRASRISPMTAVSGAADIIRQPKRASKKRLVRIEWALGFRHAALSKKSKLLMTASFSLSIILLLCFSVGLDFARELLPSMRSWQPDITLNGYANAPIPDCGILNELRETPGVKTSYGISYLENVPVSSSRVGTISLMSYSDSLLELSAEDVTAGDISSVRGNILNAMTVSGKNEPLRIGDTVTINGTEITITCTVSSSVYPGDAVVICSDETFKTIAGERGYSLIGIQLDDDASDETVTALSRFAEDNVIFTDMRERNREDRATYTAAQLVLYSFIAIIAMITLFNIINSVAMSVTARIRQYGVMRAVGANCVQLRRIIAAEALSYTVSGLVIGCVAGLLLSRFLHISLITRYFGTPWSPPLFLLCIIIIYGISAVLLSVYSPAKRIKNMSITETINEL